VLIRFSKRIFLDSPVGGGRQAGSDPEQRLEGSHGRPATVEAEDELVEIGV
jgi:hypothetical protein